MPDILLTLRQAADVLTERGIADPPREAASLMSLALRKDRAFLIAHPEYELTAEEETTFSNYLTRRAAREPLQYIRGTQEFYGLEFDVEPGVLIPRPETEILVEHATGLIKDAADPFFCEVGVGSGCISVSILHEVPQAFAFGLDISEDALRITDRNAEKNGVTDRLKLTKSDVFDVLTAEKFDLIVSNPPYIPQAEYDQLQPEVRYFEPRGALTDGAGGLSIIERIIKGSPAYLASGGYLLMEIGFGQAECVRAMFDLAIWGAIDVIPDLQSIPRVVKARLR